MDFENRKHEDVVAGRNEVSELLRSARPVECVMIAKGNTGGPVKQIIDLARERDVPVKDVSPAKLDGICGGVKHQGVAAVAAAHEYSTVEEILKTAQDSGKPPFLIIADDISDPHNLGAIVRSAEAAGAHGVIIPKRNAAGLTMTVAKASSGALEYVPVARVGNLVSTIEELKKSGIWIYGADMQGKPYYQVDLSGPAAIVIGSEGNGISRLIRDKCDFLVSIPMYGRISSLNASVAAGILMFEAAKCRNTR